MKVKALKQIRVGGQRKKLGDIFDIDDDLGLKRMLGAKQVEPVDTSQTKVQTALDTTKMKVASRKR